MCCLFTCFAWCIDAVQRAWVFAMSCCVCTAICTMLIICSVSGVALGYNYALAEYVELKETNISVFLKRGVFDDTVVDEMDWRRGGGGPAAIERAGKAAGAPQEAPARRSDDGGGTTNYYNYPGDSIFDTLGTAPESYSTYDHARHGYEGSLLKLTGKPSDTEENYRRLMPSTDSENSALNAPIHLMTLAIGPGIVTESGRTIVIGDTGNTGPVVETTAVSQDVKAAMSGEEVNVIQKLLFDKKKEAIRNQAMRARTNKDPTTMGRFTQTYSGVPVLAGEYGLLARRAGYQTNEEIPGLEGDVGSKDLRENLNKDPPKWYTSRPKSSLSTNPRTVVVPPVVYHSEVSNPPMRTIVATSGGGVVSQPRLTQEEFRRAMMESFTNDVDINLPMRTSNAPPPTRVQEVPIYPIRTQPETPIEADPMLMPGTRNLPHFMQADNDVDAIMKSDKEYYEEEDINGRPMRRRRRKSAKIKQIF